MSSSLFSPIHVGPVSLKHRVVLSPLTRYRATAAHVPYVPLMKEYYSQRGSTPGTLLITEATFIAPQAGGFGNVPGIWNQEQIDAWKEITTGVHSKGSFIFLQLWAVGRTAIPAQLRSEDPSYPYVAPSPIKLKGKKEVPRELTVSEIKQYVQWYATAAGNAMQAGFDGIEIHGANGYLPDQFLQDVSNTRTDSYGGSVENRARFTLEVVDAVVKAIGPERVGIRLSPWSTFQEMRMSPPSIIETFTYVVTTLSSRHSKMAYIHVVEPRTAGDSSVEGVDGDSNDFIRDIWLGDGKDTEEKVLISAGGYTRESAIECADSQVARGKELVAFGRHFLANPDLPLRLLHDIPFNPYDRKTFYVPGDTVGKGYIDYPFADISETAKL